MAPLSTLLTLELTLAPTALSSELRLLATLPVAVASTLERLLARDAASEVMDATLDVASEMTEESPLPVTCEAMSEATELAREDAGPRCEVRSPPSEEASESADESAVCRGPPGSAESVVVTSVVVAAKSCAFEVEGWLVLSYVWEFGGSDWRCGRETYRDCGDEGEKEGRGAHLESDMELCTARRNDGRVDRRCR